MRFDFEKVVLRIEARRVRCAAEQAGVACPRGVRAILAQDTPDLAHWDDLSYRQWCARHGLDRCPDDLDVAEADDDGATWIEARPDTFGEDTLHAAGVGG